MKIFVCVVLLIAAVYGKKELQVSNFCKKYTIAAAGEVYDEKTSGAIDGNSVLHISAVMHEDTTPQEPFDITFHFYVSKYVVFGYVPLPQLVHDKIGQALAGALGNVHYLGNSNVRAACPFKPFPGSEGHCMPHKGSGSLKLAVAPYMKDIRKAVGSLAQLASGWFKVWVTGKTSFGKEALCVLVEANINFA